ncbi:hypothetical protein F5Y07DRAFT_367438 [Xylaria sp. FL0933]|nr:hypothetical protein F5Y07DRAFT_367438 [Xylaria sp. FL0933]
MSSILALSTPPLVVAPSWLLCNDMHISAPCIVQNPSLAIRAQRRKVLYSTHILVVFLTFRCRRYANLINRSTERENSTSG